MADSDVEMNSSDREHVNLPPALRVDKGKGRLDPVDADELDNMPWSVPERLN
jgi:hypothetical protein